MPGDLGQSLFILGLLLGALRLTLTAVARLEQIIAGKSIIISGKEFGSFAGSLLKEEINEFHETCASLEDGVVEIKDQKDLYRYLEAMTRSAHKTLSTPLHKYGDVFVGLPRDDILDIISPMERPWPEDHRMT